jgi:hypothetical protein
MVEPTCAMSRAVRSSARSTTRFVKRWGPSGGGGGGGGEDPPAAAAAAAASRAPAPLPDVPAPPPPPPPLVLPGPSSSGRPSILKIPRLMADISEPRSQYSCVRKECRMEACGGQVRVSERVGNASRGWWRRNESRDSATAVQERIPKHTPKQSERVGRGELRRAVQETPKIQEYGRAMHAPQHATVRTYGTVRHNHTSAPRLATQVRSAHRLTEADR